MTVSVPTIAPISPPEVVADLECRVGEGPVWDDRRNFLFWVDIPAGRLYAYDPSTNKNTLVYQHTEMIGGFTLQEDGALLLFCSRGAVLHLVPETGELDVIIEAIAEELDRRFNDVEAAPDGGVFCGTMSSEHQPARLYRLDPNGELIVLFDDLGLSNGIGFSPDLTTMYHTDTSKRVIHAMDYHERTGAVSNRRILVQDHPGEGYPDGMTVDTEGNLWSARWDGRAIYRYAPDGTCTGRVRIPARKASSIAFGGADYADTYVTTALGERGDTRASEGDFAGSLFRLKLPAAGRAPFRSRIGLV